MTVPLSSTKHFKVTQQLRQKVDLLDPGQELPTHRSLMDEFGASQATIDRAMTTLRREGLVSRPDGSRRLIVSEVMENVSLRVRIIRPDWPSNVYDLICRGLTQLGHEKNWLFEYTFYRMMAGLDMEHAIGSSQVGIFLTTSEQMPEHLIKAFNRPRVPLVMVQDHRPEMAANCVCIDDRNMSQVAVEHLIENGHRRVLLVLPTSRTGPMRDCISGWRDAMSKTSQVDFDSLILDMNTPSGVDSRQHAYEKFTAFLQSDHLPFSAIYTANHSAMFAVMRALREQGVSVPEQVSLVSADSNQMDGAFMSPPVTTMLYDPNAQARAVMRLIEQQVASPKLPAKEIWIQGYICKRESVMPFSGKLYHGLNK